MTFNVGDVVQVTKDSWSVERGSIGVVVEEADIDGEVKIILTQGSKTGKNRSWPHEDHLALLKGVEDAQRR